MVVITDEKDVVREIALIPGARLSRLPSGWHLYFPVTEALPAVGAAFVPNLDSQPWLAEHTGD